MMRNPTDEQRMTKMRKPKASADGKYDPTDMLTALEDIILMVGEPNTETDHRIKMIAERAIAKAKVR
jgi:hypothetical protein